MSRRKRLQKLLSAQEQLEGLALATAARADMLLAEDTSENAAFVRNASGDYDLALAPIVAQLCSVDQRSVRTRQLSSTAEQSNESAKAEGRLKHQLQRLLAARLEAERKDANRRLFADQLETVAVARQSSVAPVRQNRLDRTRQEPR